MSNGAIKRLNKAGLANVEAIRIQAEALLCLLDESGLSEAAALMATTVDAIDSHMRRMRENDVSEIDNKN
jgi:hypothetical protein